jgi:uncharacterized protein
MKTFGASLALFLTLLAPLFAFTFPDKPETFVSDYAGVMDEESKASLLQNIRTFEASTTNQIAIVTVKSLEGKVINEESAKLFAKWGIGQKGKDNGVLFLVAVDDRAMRIEVGYGLEGVIPDSIAKRIIDEEAKPFFKQGKYASGIKNTVYAIEGAIGGEYTANTTVDEKLQEATREYKNNSSFVDTFGNPNKDIISFLSILVIPLFFFLILFSICAQLFSYYLKKSWIGAIIGLAVGAIFSYQFSIVLIRAIFFVIPFTLLGFFLAKLASQGKLFDNNSKRRGGGFGSGFGGSGSSSSDSFSSSSSSDDFGGGSSGGGGASSSW